MQKVFFSTYLPNQKKKQGRGIANKQFFKDGLVGFIAYWLAKSLWDNNNYQLTVQVSLDNTVQQYISGLCPYSNQI